MKKPESLAHRKIKIVPKPWGREIWFALNPRYCGKIISIRKGHRLSLAYHKIKHETIYVLQGRLSLMAGKRRLLLGPGKVFTITPRMIHRFAAPQGNVTLVEVSTPEVWDVVRLTDDYGRA